MKGRKLYSSGFKRKTHQYFGPDQHASIVLYLNTPDEKEKQQIYVDSIYPTFRNLVMGLVQTYGFTVGVQNPDDMISDCINFLYEKLHRFDANHGSKAFSYFNVVARNWLINTSRKKKNHRFKHISIEEFVSFSMEEKNTISNLTYDSPEEIMQKAEKRDEILRLFHAIGEKLQKEEDKACLRALLEVIHTLDDIDIIHKKAIYLYLRDITNMSTKQLSLSMSNIKVIYRKIISSGDFS